MSGDAPDRAGGEAPSAPDAPGARASAGDPAWLAPATRALTIALLAAVGLLAVLAATAWVEPEWRHTVDSAIYLLTGKSLALGEGYTYLGRPFFVRPPALSWCLAQTWDGDWDFALYNQLIQISVAASLVTLLLAMRRLHGWLLAALVTVLFAVNPLAVEAQNEVLAEYPYLALFFLGAWLASDRKDGRQAPLPLALLGALALAAATAFRTVGVLFLPGLVLVDLLKRDRRRWQGALVAAIVAASLVPWVAYTREAARSAEKPSTQLLMFDYTTALFRTNPSDPDSPLVDAAGWFARLASNTAEIGETCAHAFLGGERNDATSVHGPEAPILAAFFGLCLLYAAWSRRSALDLYALATAAVVLLYFTFTDRLLLPLVPLMLSAALFTLDRLGVPLLKRLVAERDARIVLLGGFALTVGLLGAAMIPESRAQSVANNRNHQEALRTARWIEKNLPPDAVLLHEWGSIFTVLTGRTTYTYRNLPGPWPDGCPEVDYALFSPRPGKGEVRMETEELIAEATGQPIMVNFKWEDMLLPIRIYTMR